MTTKYQSVALEAKLAKTLEHPLDHASLVSKLFFSWATPLLSLGNERQLDSSDIWALQDDYRCHVTSATFEPTFSKSRSILWTIFRTYGWRFAFIGVLQIATVGCTLYGPVVLRQILSAVETNTFDVRAILKLIASLFVVKLVAALLSAHSSLENQLISVKITSALQHLLYQKTMQLDSKFRREKTAGEISNMFSNDIQWIINFSINANQLWLVPVQVVVTLMMLYDVIGWATFVGAGVIVLTLVANHFVSVLIRNGFDDVMQKKDTRMKTINEVFGAMQIIKLNAWEERFGDKITAERTDELAALWRIFVRTSMSTVVLYLGPVVVTIVSFATYTMVMHESLSAAKMFTALTLFNLLKWPLSGLPYVITTFMQALVASKRFMEFLDLAEKDTSAVWTPGTTSASDLASYAAKGYDISVEQASFGWDAAKPLFKDVNLKVKRGEFVVVHGSVGEGKSSLCAALLGEMDKYEGTVFVGGRVAYFSQQAWIQNMTIRENILFGHPYDRVKYNNVLAACALSKDLTLFPAGDRTEIGQKGVNLSGGQKARISLARACYSDADIFILDSPLSAVDAIVQNEIFTKCFLGLLRHKTIVLVTHSPEIIASKFIDRIVEVKDGKLVQKVVAKNANHPILVAPLAGRKGYTVTDEDVDLESSPPSSFTDNVSLITPTSTTPFPVNFETQLFTPVVEFSGQTFDEKPVASGRLVLDEERSKGRVSAKVFEGYMQAAGGWWVFASWMVYLSIWQSLTVAGDMWLSRWSGTAAVVSDATFLDQSGFYMAIYASLSVGAVAMTVFRTLSIYASGIRASRTLFNQMTTSLLRAPMSFFDTNPLGRVLNRYSNDMNTVDMGLPFGLSGLTATAFITLFSLGTMIYVIQYMGLLLLPLLYAYAAIGRFYVQPAREMERVNKTTKSPLLNLISESIEGVLVIRAFGDKQLRRFQRQHYRNVDTNNEAAFASQVLSMWFSLRMQLTSAFVLLVVASSLVVLRDYLSAGLIGLALNYVFTVLGNFEWIVTQWSQMETAMVGPERVSEYCSIEPEPPRVISGAVAKDWPTNGDIAFTNMSFRYKENDPLVLKDVNVHIQSGEKVGIVGRTGAGKSSLTMALFRINELAGGSIKIDGVDISRVGVKTLRSSIAIIPQTPVLFKGPLRNYLDPFGEFGDADLWGCLDKVRLADRIGGVEGKLDSPVEENGENFSVGERQMLCMARALLRQARIVVMDEATAAIDHETDQNLQRVIRTEFAS
ncbi:hypothetical protein DYB31_007822, partial [Aphanomyces astaci]